MIKFNAAITAVGGYVPDSILTNADLEKLVDTNDEWIRSRTGIIERRILKEEGKASSDMAVRAILPMLEKKNIDPLEIDLIICATITGDYVFLLQLILLPIKLGPKMRGVTI